MSSTPFMPLWISDFLGKTVDLDATESGAYLLLLMAQWNMGGSLPNDHKKLQRIARCGRNWPKVWAAISHYFEEDESGIFNPKGRDVYKNATSKREVNSQNGARGGRAKALKSKNSDMANATNSPERKDGIPEPEPERIGGGGSAQARENHDQIAENQPPTFREKILTAIGVDPVSGLTGHGGRQLGTQADMAEAARWLDLPNITEAVAVEEIRRITVGKRDGPPKSFLYFTEPMQRLSASLSAPALQPIQPTPKTAQGGRNERHRQGNAVALELARRIGSGEIELGPDGCDPWAKRQ